ncbi:HAD-like protein [Fistulina hepatica ATCC 64428]|uniref:HAD-like protein n=1 Tax=Fistulina hepatica ATCC 64428 TaxID=1128425 RepID=A0A0D7AJE6_9AGAR|nr:HAD-like protein [Fistulina hepatica ATCC 64428]
MASTSTFHADAVLFDMDGTLTDSIQAVEAAWARVADELGIEPRHVIAATHGKRACDNLSEFKPHIPAHQMDIEVQRFEESILFFADAHRLHGPGSESPAPQDASSYATPSSSTPPLSFYSTPSRRSSFNTSDSSPLRSPAESHTSSVQPRRPSFYTTLIRRLTSIPEHDNDNAVFVNDDVGDVTAECSAHLTKSDLREAELELAAWQIEAASVDRSVRILPGVRKMIDSIPEGRYAVATSGAKTYAHGCMTRVGITPPAVTITADDKRLKAGKPFPDPFLLAARELGFDASRCVVFEDSPSGIRAGVASGATVIALCTSHDRSKIENCGAHYVVENMEKIHCKFDGTKLVFTIES